MLQPKISVVVPGRLHGFDMAIYFQKMGLLNELVTGYPKKFVRPFGIEKTLITSLYVNELINRTTNALGLGYPFDYLACEFFDILASKIIKLDSDIYFIRSSYALHTIDVIKKKNPDAKIILVRGSAHILKQESLLKLINKTKNDVISKRIVKKECREYALADYITVPSTFAYKSFMEYGFNEKRIFKNILGVDLRTFPFNEKRKISETLNIGYVGAISEQKNVKGIIDVMELLHLEDKKIHLHIAGQFDDNYNNKNLFDGKAYVSYYGHIPQDELYAFYRKIDLFILNSVQDGFGMVLLQAMASNCAIIATTNTGGPDIIENYKNGIIIPILNNEKLREAILWFINNKDKISEMGKLNRTITQNGYSWDDFGRRNIDFVKRILTI